MPLVPLQLTQVLTRADAEAQRRNQAATTPLARVESRGRQEHDRHARQCSPALSARRRRGRWTPAGPWWAAAAPGLTGRCRRRCGRPGSAKRTLTDTVAYGEGIRGGISSDGDARNGYVWSTKAQKQADSAAAFGRVHAHRGGSCAPGQPRRRTAGGGAGRTLRPARLRLTPVGGARLSGGARGAAAGGPRLLNNPPRLRGGVWSRHRGGATLGAHREEEDLSHGFSRMVQQRRSFLVR